MTRSLPTRRCPHCGRELKPLTLPASVLAPRSDGKERDPVVLGFEPCDCPGAERERADAARAEEERIAAEERAKRKRAYERAGIKPRFMEAESPVAATILESARDGRGTYIFGPVGTGKTHMASAVARMAIDAGMRVRVTDMPDIAVRIKDTFKTKDGEGAVLSSLSRCDLLVVDDLGKEVPTPWTLMQVFRILNDRYETMKPVVVTSQYDLKSLGGRLSRNGDIDTALAIVSRLYGMCGKRELAGRDRRVHGQG